MLKKKDNKTSKRLTLLLNFFRYPIYFLWIGWQQKKFLQHFRYLFRILGEQFYGTVFRFKQSLNALGALQSDQSIGNFDEEHLSKIHRKSLSLHSTLPHSVNYHYSFIFMIDDPHPKRFQKMLESVFLQTAKQMEVLLGCNGEPSPEILKIIEGYEKKQPVPFRKFEFSKQPSSRLINQLIGKARGNILLFADPECWLRPDMLYRYEQTLHLLENPEKIILHSSEYQTNERGELSLKFGYSPSHGFHPPYLFTTHVPACFLLFKKAWNDIGGLQEDSEGAHFYDLFLRLIANGMEIKKICLPLSAKQKHLPEEYQPNSLAAINSLQAYVQSLNLRWTICEGSISGTLRAIPSLEGVPCVHAIIPFKNQKALTIASVNSLKKQNGVDLRITAIDNQSEDLSIATELEKMGVEVIRIEEPFNFSRLNNLAVKQSAIGKECPLLFFMNNDVEMDENALLEMCRWIDQPQIGIVGCRLSYPNGLLQCGGIDLDDELASWQLVFNMTESRLPYEKLSFQRTLRIADAITGAATLIKKSTFLEVGGFDELWYPITFSDVNLIEKIKARGLKAFYTPYATGIHHESMSRTVNFLEDYESSYWLHNQYFEHIFPKLSKLPLSQ